MCCVSKSHARREEEGKQCVKNYLGEEVDEIELEGFVFFLALLCI